MSNSDGDRVLGPELLKRIEDLDLTVPQFAAKARVSKRAVNYAVQADRPRAGKVVYRKIAETLRRLEAGEEIEEDQAFATLRVEAEPGVWITVNAEQQATFGNWQKVIEEVRRLADH